MHASKHFPSFVVGVLALARTSTSSFDAFSSNLQRADIILINDEYLPALMHEIVTMKNKMRKSFIIKNSTETN
jgi:hypothetical protein